MEITIIPLLNLSEIDDSRRKLNPQQILILLKEALHSSIENCKDDGTVLVGTVVLNDGREVQVTLDFKAEYLVE